MREPADLVDASGLGEAQYRLLGRIALAVGVAVLVGLAFFWGAR